MSKYVIPEPEDLIPCPYDETHMVRAKRFPYHLMKCRKNHIGREYAVCPFNARHEMPRPEIRHHIANCPDKALLEQDLAFAQRCEKVGHTRMDLSSSDVVRGHECWDNAITQLPIFSETLIEYRESILFRKAKCLNPSEKKICSEWLRINFKQEQAGIPPLSKDEIRGGAGSSPKPTSPYTESGLRLPRNVPQALKYESPARPQSNLNKVFQNRLSMAGIGRGLSRDPPVVQRVGSLMASSGGEHGDPDSKARQSFTQANYASMLHRLGVGRGILAPTGLESEEPRVGIGRDAVY